MKKLSILFSLAFGLFLVSAVNAQTPTVVTFAKGSSEKTLSVTVPSKGEKKFSITVKKGQVINFNVSGDIDVSKQDKFPVIYLSLLNAQDEDKSQDGEAYLSIIAGRTGTYIVGLTNSDKKRARTFSLKVKVSNNKEDFAGGEEVN